MKNFYLDYFNLDTKCEPKGFTIRDSDFLSKFFLPIQEKHGKTCFVAWRPLMETIWRIVYPETPEVLDAEKCKKRFPDEPHLWAKQTFSRLIGHYLDGY